MNAKCPSCESKIISFITDNLTSERVFSCIDCGSEWNNSVDVDPSMKSRLGSLLGLNNKQNKLWSKPLPPVIGRIIFRYDLSELIIYIFYIELKIQ